jgi:hypothetical protein
MKVYTQWLVGDESQAILPMTGTPPVLPETMTPPDINTIIDFHYAMDAGFGVGSDTLAAEVLPK